MSVVTLIKTIYNMEKYIVFVCDRSNHAPQKASTQKGTITAALKAMRQAPTTQQKNCKATL